MRSAHIRSLALAVAVTTAATGLAGTAFAAPAAGETHATAATASQADRVVEAARTAAFAHASATGVGQGDELQAQDVLIDPEGARHVRFVRTHQGMPVLGGDLVVHLTQGLAYAGVTRAAGHAVDPGTGTAELTARQAEAKAAAVAEGDAQSAELVVDARGGASALAYRIRVTGSDTTETGGSRTVVLDARTGKVRSNMPDSDEFLSPELLDTLRERGETLDPATGTVTQAASLLSGAPAARAAVRYPAKANGVGTGLSVGKVPLTTTRTARAVYLLKDPAHWNTETRDARNKELENFAGGRPFTTATNTWGNGAVSSRVSAAVDAQYGVTKTLDFYQKTFGRKGIANNGKGARAMVHFGNKVGNAFWDPACGCMLYGDGDGTVIKKPLVVLDVTGHELTHGVVDATARLEPTSVDADGNQFGEPGSLNESLADIFGSNVEFSANNPKNPPNYLIGERLGLDQKFLRRLDKPSLDVLEGTIDYWSPEASHAEVHAGSGVSSHAYYLLAEGSGRKKIGGFAYDSPTFDGAPVKGIGRAKATAIFYRALTRYMVSTTDFHDARTATLKAAKDLYGATSTEYLTVDRAWAAVNVTAANTPAARR
ncbi:Zn-dependent metalloprotease [Streptomyces sp. yr375]|uniref:M4 family metallopeptidase n=1 Tax=Streptomyces sp. yr375 TaxID=1761906 RepID=UPI0008CEE2CA|nr:M4 family metallopeptidase [Streptomyces sp. yr375]SES43020.1 Zn-dependent metalloprotease [Streptomyces sp. yr375]